MNFFKTLDSLLMKTEEFLSALAMLSMCLIVFVTVVCRFALQLPFAPGEEIARYLLVWCIFIGIIVATRKGAHVAVEAFVDWLPPKPRAFFIFLSQLITTLAFAALFYLAIKMIERSTGPLAQRTPLTRIPYYVMYISLAVGFGFSTLRSLQIMVKRFLLKKEPRPKA